MLKPEEVTHAIQKEIQKYEKKLRMESVGYVLQVGDGIARVYGLESVMAGELVEFPNEVCGAVFNLEPDNVGIVILGSDTGIKEGDVVKRTEKILQTPVGKALLPRCDKQQTVGQGHKAGGDAIFWQHNIYGSSRPDAVTRL